MPGYSFVHISEIAALESAALPADKYNPIMLSEKKIHEIKSFVGSLAKRIQSADSEHAVASLICRTISGGQIDTKLGYTVKTHKDQGEVMPRSLRLSR